MTIFNGASRGWLFGAASVAVLSVAAPAAAQSLDARRSFNIPPESVADALMAFSRQSTIQVVTASADLGAARTRGVAGDLTAREALGRLLDGTKLRWREVGQGSIIVEAGPLAQGAAEASNSVDEVVVTANKRAERLHDVPASVTALTAQSLAEIGAVKFEDYVSKVPGLMVDNTSAGGGLSQVSIRGITTGSGGNPAVGFYIDDAPFGSSTLIGRGSILSPDLDPSDLQRIEVLRGPQGTLYGAGAMGGLIKFVTTAPDFSRFSGRLQADGSQVDGGGTGYGLRGAVNIPVNDRLAIRASAFDREDPGFIDDPATGQKNVNSARNFGGRVALAWRVNDNWTLRLSALNQELRGDGTPIVDFDAVTGRPLQGDLQQVRAAGTGKARASYGLYDIHLEGDLGLATLVSATSYSKVTSNINTDATVLYGPVVTGVFGIPDVGAAILTDSGLDKFTQELRLSSPATARLAWQVGGFYTREHAFVTQGVPVFNAITGGPLVPPLPDLIDVVLPSTFEEIAGFGDLTFHVNSRFDVTGGIRYSHNTQSAQQTLGGLLVGPPSVADSKSDDSSVTWLVTPRFHINDETMVYARVATGYRPGGPNTAGIGVPPSFGPDKVINYEAGLKTDLLDHRLSFDVAAFYIDWTDIQLTQISPLGLSYFSNGGKASSRGVEGSFDWRPVGGLDIAGNVSYMDARLDSDLPPPAIGFKGDQLPSIPHWSGQVSADYQFPLAGQWSGFVGASYRFVGDRMSEFSRSAAIPRYALPSYEMVDLRLGAKTDRWTVTAYAKNVGDARGQVTAFNLGAVQEVALVQPRTFGLSLSTDF
jgi:outer membrane receptor protein involved in Fe transport